MAAKETPLMKQYYAIKAKHPGALLLFRVGDFYETFGEDAEKASKILGIVLTKRSNGAASEVALAGFPHHALDTYLPKLIRAGNRVAICDQLEDPKSVKGIVKRGVTELVTPGVHFNDQVHQPKSNTYLGSITSEKDRFGFSLLDISTGEFLLSEVDKKELENLIQAFRPSEILLSKKTRDGLNGSLAPGLHSQLLEDWIFTPEYGREKLNSQFETSTLKGFGIENFDLGISAAGAILQYLKDTEHKELRHIRSISRIDNQDFVWLDRFSIRNLELLYPQQEGGIALFDVLDKTQNPMGGRLLRKWIAMPLKDEVAINKRLEMVDQLVKGKDLRENLIRVIREIGDLERLISKVAAKRINPKELKALSRSLEASEQILDFLKESKAPGEEFFNGINIPIDLIKKVNETLLENPPILSNLGGLIKDSYSKELDELRSIANSGKEKLEEIRDRESERTQIPKLKISYNKVFGYYLEVSNAHKEKVPPEWIRKQTLVNAERYITDELKIFEEKILNADERIKILEAQLFSELVEFSLQFIPQIQNIGFKIAELDCLLSFADLATTSGYSKPKLNPGRLIQIKQGRHPVIEQQLPPGESYIPNDVYLDPDSEQILIITGPNMAGKSALLRQTALICLMAQMGSFVPAAEAEIGIVDKVFSRVGASDNVSRGESTFMVEMTETASILNNLSDRSLVIMDEIGRGTSTFDGISIAWAIVEYLHNISTGRPKTLFATHYHELNDLSNTLNRVRNFNVSVKEVGDKVLFLRTLKPGGSQHSFGIHVAQMAGIPNEVVLRADEVMRNLEEIRESGKTREALKKSAESPLQMNMFGANDPQYVRVKEMLESLDVNVLSPVEALLKLNELTNIFRKK